MRLLHSNTFEILLLAVYFQDIWYRYDIILKDNAFWRDSCLVEQEEKKWINLDL
jgi:hypothetical protein